MSSLKKIAGSTANLEYRLLQLDLDQNEKDQKMCASINQEVLTYTTHMKLWVAKSRDALKIMQAFLMSNQVTKY